MKNKRTKSILLSLIVAASMSCAAFAQSVTYPQFTDPLTNITYWITPSGLVAIPVATPTPPVQAVQPTQLVPVTELNNQKVLGPTDLNLNITNNLPVNLAGSYIEVAPLEETRIVNNLDSELNDSVGAIAINNSADHVIAVSDFTPVGAASQVGNNGQADLGNFDFVIESPIIE